MGKCFVIQPFDRGKFDKRYRDVFAPAIKAVGLEPYRVDQDPSVAIPMDDIVSGIGKADVCLADISTDNPNVWFELGYAIALRKEVVLVCSDERTSKFPFDVQDRTIISYSTESGSDFDELRSRIETRITARLGRRSKLAMIGEIQSVARLGGLKPHEIAVLVSVASDMEGPEGGVPVHGIVSAMEAAGFTKLATTLGLTGLVSHDMLESYEDEDYNGERWIGYRLTGVGLGWLSGNEDSLVLRREVRAKADDDDLPF